MTRLLAHLDHEHDMEQGLDRPGREPVFGRDPGLVRNRARHLSRQEKRSYCCRVKCRAVPPTTNPGARETHCRVRGAVGCLEGDRSGHGETETVQPATGHVDAY